MCIRTINKAHIEQVCAAVDAFNVTNEEEDFVLNTSELCF